MTIEWDLFFKATFNKIKPLVEELEGIILGFNTCVDTVVRITPKIVKNLLLDTTLLTSDILEGIKNWKGKIENIDDFIIALIGCIQQGKASEWIVSNKQIYNELINCLPISSNFSMGGQAGIMANVLSALDVPNIFVHVAALPKEQIDLFLPKENIKIPIIQNKQLVYCSPTKLTPNSETLYLHIISEFNKGLKISLDTQTEIICPRDNRLIATYDPFNAEMIITDPFKKSIKDMSEKSNGAIISGFHMLETNNDLELNKKIKEILNFLAKIKTYNPELSLQLELCSTKHKDILNQLIQVSEKFSLWDSLSCNERELAELLEVFGEQELARKIKERNDQKAILEGALLISNKLILKRFHLHQLGCYLVVSSKVNSFTSKELKESLGFAAVVAAYRATYGEFGDFTQIGDFFNVNLKNFKKTAQYIEMENEIRNLKKQRNFENNGYTIIAIPTIIIDKPKLIVGLGDTISSSAFVAELAIKKNKGK